LKFHRVLLPLAIIILVSGVFLFALTTVRETLTSGGTSRATYEALGGTFGYGGITEAYNAPPQSIVGTSGIAVLMILTTPFRNFNSWVCNHMPPPQLDPEDVWSCANFGGGNGFNITILYSYLQTNQSQIAYSQTIVDQNVSLTSLSYHVSSWTDVTTVLAQLGSGWATDYSQVTVTNETTSYPLIGYTESPGTIFSLPNISLGLIGIGVVGLILLSVAQPRLHPSPRSERSRGSTTRKCPSCGSENLFFANKCRHCGRVLDDARPMIEAQSH
jgi:hypothetical protein